MKKLILLIRVLFRCGKPGKAEQSNSAVGDTTTLISLAVGLAAAVGMFFAGGYAAEHIEQLGSGDMIFTTVLTVAGMVAFFLTMMNAVNQLYISSDLDVLITLPFSPMQIVTAKLVSVGVYPALICFGLSIPAAIGYAAKAEGLSALFIPSMVIGALLLTVYVVALVASLLMIIMRTFRFVRSRNMLSVISTLIVFALTMGYILANPGSQELGEAQAVGLFHTISGVSKSLGFLFPTAGFSVDAAFGEVIGLVYALLAVICALAVLTLLSRTIYLSAALSMTDANGSREKISAAGMKKHTAQHSLRGTLARHEIRQIFRTPALITNGYLYSIVAPFAIVLPIVFKGLDELKSMTEAEGLTLRLEDLRVLAAEIPPMLLLFCGALFGLLMAAFAVSLSCLSRFMISRDGKDFALIKTMPIRARELVFVKRNVALIINSISGFIFPAVLFIVLAALGLFPIWVSALCIISDFAWIVLFIDICAATDVKKPNLNWETETDVTKNNTTGVVILLVSFGTIIGLGFLMSNMYDTIKSFAGVVVCAVPIVSAVICDIRLSRLADRLF